MEPLNGWQRVDDATACDKGRRLALLEWLATRRGLDASEGVIFYKAGRAWILATRSGTLELGAASWGPRTYDRDLAMREAWADATGRVGVPEVDAIRDQIAAWSSAPAPAPTPPTVSRHGNADREQLALLGGRR